MIEILPYAALILLSLLQSIAGVGILVLGTPLLLLLDYDMINIMKILLPISMYTSLINIIIIKKIYLKKAKSKIDFKLFKYFIIFCFPFIFLGLFVLKTFSYNLDINLLVAITILVSMLFKFNKFTKIKINKNTKKIFTSLIGFVHGLTNSGGTILTLFMTNNKEKDKTITRFEIHIFYLLLAAVQFGILLIISNPKIDIYYLNIITAFIIFLSSFLGNYLSEKIEKITSFTVYVLASISAVILILK